MVKHYINGIRILDIKTRRWAETMCEEILDLATDFKHKNNKWKNRQTEKEKKRKKHVKSHQISKSQRKRKVKSSQRKDTLVSKRQ